MNPLSKNEIHALNEALDDEYRAWAQSSAIALSMDSLWKSMPMKSMLDFVMSTSDPVIEWVTP